MIDWLHRMYFGNSLLTWSVALGVAGGVFALFSTSKRIVLRKLVVFADRTRTDLDDIHVEVLRATKPFTLLMVALYVSSGLLALEPRWEQIGKLGLVLVLLLQGAIWTTTTVGSSLDRTLHRRAESDGGSATALNALGFVSRIAIWSVFLLMALDNLGVNVTGLVAGLGIGGLAVALALQNILGDLFASISIVLDKPFEIGDFIILGDFLGVVERIGLKTTRLRSLSGEQIIFSKSDLLASRVRNFKRMFERRVVFALGVTFQTPPGKLSTIPPMLREIVENQEGVRFDRAHFKEIGDSALLFEIVYFLLDPDYNHYRDTQQAINLEIMRRFEAEGIDLAYPTQTVFLEGQAAHS